MAKKKTYLYARVSTDQQSSGLESQCRALKKFCEQNDITSYELFTDENISGAKASRPSLNRMMESIRSGEAEKVVVFSFSRFARSTTHLLSALQEFKKYKVQFVSLSEKIDTESAMGVAMFTILGALAQLERELIAERVKAGLANARAKGKIIGRKKTRNSELIRALLAKNLSYRAIASIADVSHGSIYAEKISWKKEIAEKEQKEREAKLSKSNENKDTLNFDFEKVNKATTTNEESDTALANKPPPNNDGDDPIAS